MKTRPRSISPHNSTSTAPGTEKDEKNQCKEQKQPCYTSVKSFRDHPTAAQDTKGGTTTATISKIICFSLAKKYNFQSAKSLEFHFKV